MPHVLLIEDSEECQWVVRRALAGSGIELTCSGLLEDARAQLKGALKDRVSLILLDIDLPDGDGLSLLDDLQKVESLRNTPVFLLTSTEEVTRKVMAFGKGAEDYLVKPVNPVELKARVEMRLKKSQANKQSSDSTIRKGELVVDPVSMKAAIMKGSTETVLDLTGKEFKILSFLARNEDKIFTRAELVKAVWGPGVHVLDRTVDSHICGLRKELGELASYVESIPNAGYRFHATKPADVR